MKTNTRPLVVTLLIGLFVIGTAASLVSAISLSLPGSSLEKIWQLNPQARESFARMGGWSILLMGFVCVMCLLTSIGLWRGRKWGYWLSLAMLTINLIGDVTNVVGRGEYRAAVGIPIVLSLLIFLTRKKTRDYFENLPGCLSAEAC